MAEAEQEHGQNSPNGKILGELLKSHFRVEEDIDRLRMKHAQEVGKLRKLQGDVRERVKGSGYSVRAFKIMVTEEHDKRRASNRLAQLDDEDREGVDVMREALQGLADLPLGQAAVEQAEKKQARASRRKTMDAELDSLGTAPGGPGAGTAH